MAVRRSRCRHRKISFFQYFAVLLYHFFSGSKRPWLTNKMCYCVFFNFLSNGILFIKFDALTAGKIIFKKHMKFVSVKFVLSLSFSKVDLVLYESLEGQL